MHNIDCDGVAEIIFASVVVCIIRSAFLGIGNNMDERLEHVEDLRIQFYTDNRVQNRMAGLKIANLFLSGTGSSYAALHGPMVKAANTRDLIPFAVQLACTFFPVPASMTRA